MRTTGTFLDIFNAAREHEAENHEHLPHNAVVRRAGSKWMLDSGLDSSEDCDLEISYEAFLGYWYEGLIDPLYSPSESDIENYIDFVTE